jgi:hypothetical protein
MPRRTECHQAAAHGDAADPDSERRLAAKVVEVLEHRDQGVLREVLGQGPVAHEPADDGQRPTRHPIEQNAARRRVAGPRRRELLA